MIRSRCSRWTWPPVRMSCRERCAMAELDLGLLVVGQNSFIAGHLLRLLPKDGVRAVSHHQLDRPDLLDAIGTVLNAARHPDSNKADTVASG